VTSTGEAAWPAAITATACAGTGTGLPAAAIPAIAMVVSRIFRMMGSKQNLTGGTGRTGYDLMGSALFKPLTLPTFCTDFEQFVGCSPALPT
jgi:hypothetical protein